MRREDAEVGDHRARPAAARRRCAHARRGRRGSRRVVRKSSRSTKLRVRRLEHHERLPRMRGDFRRAAGTGQARRRRVVRTDHGAVEVAVAVDLRRAEEADVDASGLQVVAEHFRQRDDEGRGLGQLAVADRQRQHVGRVPIVPDS